MEELKAHPKNWTKQEKSWAWYLETMLSLA